MKVLVINQNIKEKKWEKYYFYILSVTIRIHS